MQLLKIHEAILNFMGEAVYVLDREMSIIYANPAAEALTGYSLPESIGAACHDIFCERSDICPGRCPLKRAMQDRVPVLHKEAETRRKDGRIRQTQISIAPFIEDGECVGVVIVVNDVTELREALAKVRTLSGLLPICASCKNIRDDRGYWRQIESYIREHSEAEFSHSLCPDCAKKLYPQFFKE